MLIKNFDFFHFFSPWLSPPCTGYRVLKSVEDGDRNEYGGVFFVFMARSLDFSPVPAMARTGASLGVTLIVCILLGRNVVSCFVPGDMGCYAETLYTLLGGEAQKTCRKKITIILTATVFTKDPTAQDRKAFLRVRSS